MFESIQSKKMVESSCKAEKTYQKVSGTKRAEIVLVLAVMRSDQVVCEFTSKPEGC